MHMDKAAARILKHFSHNQLIPAIWPLGRRRHFFWNENQASVEVVITYHIRVTFLLIQPNNSSKPEWLCSFVYAGCTSLAWIVCIINWMISIPIIPFLGCLLVISIWSLTRMRKLAVAVRVTLRFKSSRRSSRMFYEERKEEDKQEIFSRPSHRNTRWLKVKQLIFISYLI